MGNLFIGQGESVEILGVRHDRDATAEQEN